jgi:hypothetical protein
MDVFVPLASFIGGLLSRVPEVRASIWLYSAQAEEGALLGLGIKGESSHYRSE